MNILELNHIALHIFDLGKSISFYKDVLELDQIKRPAFDFEGAWFRIAGGQQLHLIGARKGKVYSGPIGSHFSLRVESIEDSKKKLLEKNYPFNGPSIRPDGAFQIFLADPDGYIIELTELQN